MCLFENWLDLVIFDCLLAYKLLCFISSLTKKKGIGKTEARMHCLCTL